MNSRQIYFVLISLLFIGCSSIPYTSGLLECDTDIFNTMADVALFNASKTGDIYSLEDALKDGANVNACDRLGQTALMWACWNGNSEVIKRLISYDDKKKKESSFFNHKKYEPLKYNATSKEKYNALFCLIMSNSIRKDEALECINLILEKESTLLTMSDQFNENCLHKSIRSGNTEYLLFFLEKLKAQRNKKSIEKLIEQKNIFKETPLVLAVKLQQSEMTKTLIENKADINVKDLSGSGLSVLAFDNGDGDYYVFLEIMKAKLQNAIDSKTTPEDAELKECIEKNQSKYTIHELENFIKVYDKFSSGEIKNPDELDDGVFIGKEKKFFDIFLKVALTSKDVSTIKQMLEETPALMYSTVYVSSQDMYKTALQLSIEKGNVDLFNMIFNNLNMNRVRKVGRGLGDYLTCSILYAQTEIIETLLDFNSKGFCPEDLMAVYHSISSDLNEFRVSNPVVLFMKLEKLMKNEELFRRVLVYYKSQFSENTNYAGQIFEEALNHKDESLLLFLTKFPGFEKIQKVFGGRPLQFELIENEYFETLKYYIENGDLNFLWPDTKGNIAFIMILENNKSDLRYKEILDMLVKKGIIMNVPDEVTQSA